MSHNLDVPIAHECPGHKVFLKFVGKRPNDLVPASETIVEPFDLHGLGEVVAILSGSWPDFPVVLDEAI